MLPKLSEARQIVSMNDRFSSTRVSSMHLSHAWTKITVISILFFASVYEVLSTTTASSEIRDVSALANCLTLSNNYVQNICSLLRYMKSYQQALIIVPFEVLIACSNSASNEICLVIDKMLLFFRT